MKFKFFSDKELASVNQLLMYRDFSGWFQSHDGGPHLQEFQNRFAEFCGAKNAFAVSSGSTSIYIALRVCGVKRGDFVAVPAYTHIGSVAPIILANAKPLFIDVNEDGTMNPQDLKKALSLKRYKDKVKAVIVVHLLGRPCEMDEIKDVWSGFVIEDASQALGAEYKRRRTGVLGDVGCFSIGGGRTKTVCSGEGGMVVVNSDDLAERCKNLRNHGDRSAGCDYLCFNFRMCDLNALVGLLQLKKVDFLINCQINNAKHLIANLPSYLEVPFPPSHIKSSWYLIGCRFSQFKATMSRDAFVQKVINQGFEGGVPRRNFGKGITKLISEVKFYERYSRRLPTSRKLRAESVWIDWHRYPRTIEEIDQLLAVFRKIHA